MPYLSSKTFTEKDSPPNTLTDADFIILRGGFHTGEEAEEALGRSRMMTG